jgi:multidrug efflux system outer membrane protein
LFTSPARVWQFGPSVSLPLFTGGKIRAQNRLAEARFEEALATYQKTVESAFRDVSNALVGYQKAREFEVDQLALTLARRDAARLADIRYVGGVTSYLELLYNEQESLSAELVLAQARRNILQSVVQLYRALGGGPL